MARPNMPAFPTIIYYDEKPIGVTPGLTVREYMAAQILAGFAADPGTGPAPGADMNKYRAIVAGTAVRWADALIAALNEPKPA